MKLNLGCGTTPLDGWVNIDRIDGPGVDVVAELDALPYSGCRVILPFEDNSVGQVYGSHIFEHLHSPLALMQELWRVCEPGAQAVFRTPFGSSDDADEDPTHVRRMFHKSWLFYAQPSYYRSQPYDGYTADWWPHTVQLFVTPELLDMGDDVAWHKVEHERNVVYEMVAYLQAVKPARDRSAGHAPLNVELTPITETGDPLRVAESLGLV